MTGQRSGTVHDRRAGSAWKRCAEDEGNTLVEFVVLAVALLVPCLYLVLTLGSVQSAVFAADVIARDTARIYSMEGDDKVAAERSRAHAEMVLADFDLDAGDVLDVTCSETPCASPGATITARVRIPVQVPGVGPVLGEAGPVSVGSQQTIRVDEHRGARP